MKKTILTIALITILLLAIIFPDLIKTIQKDQSSKNNSCEDCNVLIITIDTLRYDHVSSNGYISKTTPFIDSLSSQAVTFSNAFSQIPHTPPSHWSIFSGIYPHNHKKYISEDEGSDISTLPESLSDEGYKTAAFIASEMVFGLKSEFQQFNGVNPDEIVIEQIFEKNASEMTNDAVDWVRDNYNEKFFLWVHYFDAHSSYDPPSEFDVFDYSDSDFYSDKRYQAKGLKNERTILNEIEKYDGEVRFVDENIGRLLSELDRLSLRDRTIIVVVSDHGENFGEHKLSDFGFSDDKPCMFHGKTLYDEEVKIPLVIANPNSKYNGMKFDEIVETVDIVPTIMDFLGIETDIDYEGTSIVDILDGKETNEYAVMLTQPYNEKIFSLGISDGSWKLINMRNHSSEYIMKSMLYSSADGESIDHSSSQQPKYDHFDRKLEDMFSGTSFLIDINISEQTESLLRSLGYIQ